MPRPKRCRIVCEEPYFSRFSPEKDSHLQTVEMTVDEYEVIRLVDYQRKTHEQCARQMQVARTTITEIYDSARYKLADVITNGKTLVIAGGNFRLCEGNSNACVGCKHGDFSAERNEKIVKGVDIMRIAVTYENEKIFQHFGHAEAFKVYDVEGNKIIKKTVISTDGQGHGALSAILNDNKVDVLICGGIGGGAKMALEQFGIKLYGGVIGDCDKAVEAFLQNELDYNPNVKCSHHDHEHGNEAHACGEHGCGNGSCNQHK